MPKQATIKSLEAELDRLTLRCDWLRDEISRRVLVARCSEIRDQAHLEELLLTVPAQMVRREVFETYKKHIRHFKPVYTDRLHGKGTREIKITPLSDIPVIVK